MRYHVESTRGATLFSAPDERSALWFGSFASIFLWTDIWVTEEFSPGSFQFVGFFHRGNRVY